MGKVSDGRWFHSTYIVSTPCLLHVFFFWRGLQSKLHKKNALMVRETDPMAVRDNVPALHDMRA